MQTTPALVHSYLQDTLRFFRGNLKNLALIVLPYALVSELVYRFYILGLPKEQQLFSGFMVEIILFPILQTVVVLYMAAAVSGHQRGPLQCYQHSVQFWPRMLMLSIVTTLAVMAGLSLFIVPGIYLLVRLCLSEMFCILDRQSLFEGMRSSFGATVPVTWVIFLGLVILFPGITAITLGLAQMVGATDTPLVSIAVGVVQGVLRSLYAIYLFRVYSAIKQAAK
ncbi:YciC family protein [Parendozoicomonas haliclonae]|uniref:Membrane domain of glycerophosphoryl diester phosphodiesterase n=1 Tax=Parendozoicomonas haliclonae TaxID=1960125 RepID=A0A1X7AP83_9GAMM|nr:YciC family protein [Parendozoicomonas haliclonae]SMA50096.1 hypothetical protein EHSB41UT_03887 [Parendozoicomonas haliclonae]